MTGSVALDVAIGLVFIFLLYSLLASIITEMIAAFFGLRARTLHKGIERMLEEEKEGLIKRKWPLFFNGIRDAINDFHESFSRFFKNPNYNATEKFYNYPLVKFLGRDKHFSKPSYISAQTFSKVLIDLLKNGKDGSEISKIEKGIATLKNEKKQDPEQEASFISGDTLVLVESFLNDSNNDIEKFKIILENWFDTTVQRTTGWYKRRSQLNLMVIGFFIAFFFNASTIEIANKLSKDNDAREQMVRLADNYVKENPELIENIQKLATDPKDVDTIGNDTLRTDVKVIEAKLDSLLNIKEKLNEDINKANNLLGFILPDSLIVTKADLSAEKRSLESNKKYLNDSTYYITFSGKYMADHAASYYVEKKKNRWDYFKETFLSDEKWIKQNAIKEIKREEAGNIYVYLDKGKYFWNQFWGYLLTALAISLGATFWFDLLNKFMKLRNSGQQTEINESKNSTKKDNVPLDKRVG